MTGALQLGRKWHLGEPVGRGGFGVVYAAKSGTGETAVVKLVPRAPAAQREMLFIDLGSVRNVVPVIDSGETDDAWVLVMPRAERSLPPRSTSERARQARDRSLVMAASAAHECSAHGHSANGVPVPGKVQPRHRPNSSAT